MCRGQAPARNAVSRWGGVVRAGPDPLDQLPVTLSTPRWMAWPVAHAPMDGVARGAHAGVHRVPGGADGAVHGVAGAAHAVVDVMAGLARVLADAVGGHAGVGRSVRAGIGGVHALLARDVGLAVLGEGARGQRDEGMGNGGLELVHGNLGGQKTLRNATADD